MSAKYCDECGNTGICGDEGPGMRNARHEWHPCDCPLGDTHRNQSRSEQRLHAAAPDLLAALKQFPGLDCDTEDVIRWMFKARAAIAKAEGGAA